MVNEFPSSISIGDSSLALRVERKAVKHINARLADGHLHVSVPLKVGRDEALQAIDLLAQRLVRRQRARQVNAEDDALALAQRVALRFPKPPPIRAAHFTTGTSACWGSYSARTGTVRLSAALRHMPAWVLEAVVAHELAHAFHLDHSPDFWALLRAVFPETDRANAFLAGVAWLGRHWEQLPAVERAQLAGDAGRADA